MEENEGRKRAAINGVSGGEEGRDKVVSKRSRVGADPRSSFPAAVRVSHRHLTKGGRERGGDKRGVVFMRTDDATAAETKERVYNHPLPDYTHPRHHPFRFHARAFFSRFLLLANWQRLARGSSFLVELRRVTFIFILARHSGGSYRQILFFNFHLIVINVYIYIYIEIDSNGLILDLIRERRENVEGEYIRWFVGLLIIRCKYYRQIYIANVERKYRIALCIFFVSRNESNESLILAWISNISNFTVERLIWFLFTIMNMEVNARSLRAHPAIM